ncbi:hypothetical protein [Pararhodospirillum photometricum]|nr:hypothetical protein [Pararhodospirillum photometricum]
MSLFSFAAPSPRGLLVADDLPALLLEPGRPARCLTGPDLGPGPVPWLLVDGADLRVEEESVPRVSPWLRRALHEGHRRAHFPAGAFSVARPFASPAGPRLIVAGCSDSRLGGWHTRLEESFGRPVPVIAPALALPSLARALFAQTPEPSPFAWSLILALGRAGMRQVAARDGVPVLVRLTPLPPDADALAREIDTTLAYLRRRGYRGGDPCGLLVLGRPGLPSPPPARDGAPPLPAFLQPTVPDDVGTLCDPILSDTLAPLARGAPVLTPQPRAAAEALGLPSAPLGGDTAVDHLVALWALSPGGRPVWQMRPLRTDRPADHARLARRTLGLSLGLAAVTALTLAVAEGIQIPRLMARADTAHHDLQSARDALARVEAALAALPAPPEALRALPATVPEAATPRQLAQRLRTALGPIGGVERLSLEHPGGSLEIRLTLPAPPSVLGEGGDPGRRLAVAFPGHPVTLEKGAAPEGPWQGTLEGPASLLPGPSLTVRLTLEAHP